VIGSVWPANQRVTGTQLSVDQTGARPWRCHRELAILALEHVAMIPAMVAVMLVHRGEYSLPVHQHAVG
jgi:hypothetical protein